MEDLDDDVRTRRHLLSAMATDRRPKVRPFLEDVAVVPGDRLLDAASAMARGASVVRQRLRGLGDDDREAVLNLLVDQVDTIVGLWTDLVRAVVPAGPDEASGPEQGRARGLVLRPPAPASPPAPGADAPGEDVPADPRLLAGPGRLARRSPPARQREPWATPLRSVRVDDGDGGHEGDRLTRDELTGVLNRHAGFAALGRQLDRARRVGDRFVLGYLDIDGLKALNTIEGTRAGDELLRKVSAALRATLRSYDVIMRLGGDEFLFSLPGADQATAERRAHEFGVILAEEAPGASASVGFSELRGNDTLDEIISRAEAELVQSRRARAPQR